MVRSLSVVLSLTGLLGSAGSSLAQTKVAPLYSLPADGVWVEFDFKSRDRLNKEIQGTMRISSTGRVRIGDVDHRWVEIKMSESNIETRYGKMLLVEEALRKGQPLEDNVVEAFHQEGTNGALLRYSGRQLAEHFSMGVSGHLREIKDREAITTGLGTFPCKQVESTGRETLRLARNGPGKEKTEKDLQTKTLPEQALTYRAWLSDAAPFGVVRFEIWAKLGSGPERPVFVASIVRSGTGAKSEMKSARR